MRFESYGIYTRNTRVDTPASQYDTPAVIKSAELVTRKVLNKK